jgi:isocitrate dehydrogenase
LADRLAADEATIVSELGAVQGAPVDIGGYYRPDHERVTAAMRPSATLNDALASMRA